MAGASPGVPDGHDPAGWKAVGGDWGPLDQRVLRGPGWRPKLAYLAHPVSGGRFWPALEYLQKLNKVLVPMGWVVVCPWLPQVIVCVTDDDPELRATMLAVDCFHVQAYDAFIACGTHISPGMKLELDTAVAHNKLVLDFTGWSADTCVDDLRYYGMRDA